eukprot:scaffold13281_cov119-Isochrysis_galbana.AAC.3
MSESRGSVIDSYLDVGIPSGDVFRRELDSDEFARDMMDYLLVNLRSDDQERASQIPISASRFVMKDGLLYYLSKAESTDSADLRLYIPESLRHSYMVAFHDSAGHLGVEHYVRECHECTLGKPPMRTLAQPSGPQVGAYPFDIVYCDILSMALTHDYVKGKSGYDKLVVYVD